MIYIMNSKNEIAKKDLRLAYSQGNYTTYPTNIKAAAWYLSTQYPNNKSGNQQQQQQQQKSHDPKSEDKDNTMGGTAGTDVEDSTTNEDNTPLGGASLGAHVSEISQATSPPPRTVQEILGAHPIT